MGKGKEAERREEREGEKGLKIKSAGGPGPKLASAVGRGCTAAGKIYAERVGPAGG